MKLFGLIYVTTDRGWLNCTDLKLYVYECEPDESICQKRFLICPRYLDPKDFENPKTRQNNIEILNTFYSFAGVQYVSTIEEITGWFNDNEKAKLYLKFEEKESNAPYIEPDASCTIDLKNYKEIDAILEKFRRP